MYRHPPRSPLFPYSTLSRSLLVQLVVSRPAADPNAMTDEAIAKRLQPVGRVEFGAAGAAAGGSRTGEQVDRKSTRLNSSHGYISYAVFCFKKKNNITLETYQ